MKKLFLLLFIATLSSCINTKEIAKNDIDPYLKGNHELRRLSQLERKTPSTLSASYFLFWGSASAKGESIQSYIGFAWENHLGEYVLSKVETTNIRIKFDEKANIPYVTFGYNGEELAVYQYDVPAQLSFIVSNRLHYVVIHCREQDYMPEYNIQNINP